jgi:uncharacterized surface anchored protein
VQLRAEYGPLSGATPTHITWYGNNGNASDLTYQNTTNEVDPEGATTAIEDVPINMGVFIKPEGTFTYTGYEFIGWARMPEVNANGQVISGDEVVQTFDNYKFENGFYYKLDGESWVLLDESDLFLTLTGSTFTSGGRTVSKVAADEYMPYHGLYAVWRKLPSLRVVKVDANSATTYLAGAQFTLTLNSETFGTVTTVANANGVLVEGLADGHYLLTEIAAPDGYVFEANETWLHVYNGVIYTAFDSEVEGAAAYSSPLTLSTVEGDEMTYVVTIANTPGTALPMTGGTGVQNLMYLGGTLCALALILLGRQMILRRKHEKD